jgi:hypothetical protein
MMRRGGAVREGKPVGKEGFAGEDRLAGADTGVIIAKDVFGRIKEDSFCFPWELFANADPFHFSPLQFELFPWDGSDKLMFRYTKRC